MAAPAPASVGAALTGATRTSSAVPVPPGVVANDIVLVHLYLETTSAVTPPAGVAEITGFSPAPQTTSPDTVQRVFWKRAAAADTGTYVFSHASTWTSGVAERYTGVVASGTPFEVLASAQRASSATNTPTVSATTAGGDRLLVYGATVGNSSDWTPPSGFIEVFDPPGDEVLVATKAQAAAGATGPLTASSTSSSAQTVTLLALVPTSVSTDTTPPTVPGNVVATATGPSTVSLSWDPSTDDIGVAGYSVTRNGSVVASGITGTSYGDSGLTGSTTYTYTVTAQDAAGNSSSASNTASATTSAPVAASLTVTPTVESSNVPPRIRLNIVDTRTTPASSVTVTRLNPDGTTSVVRSGDGDTTALNVSGSSRVGLLFDYEMQLGAPAAYSTLEAPGTVSAPVTIDSDFAWLIHPGVPALSMPINMRPGTLVDEVFAAKQAVFYPMGRSNPIVHTDGSRKGSQSSLVVTVSSLDEMNSIKALISDAGVLLLNIPYGMGTGFQASYIAVGDVTLSRWSDTVIDWNRDVKLPFTVVDQPVGGSQAQRTFNDVLAAFPTFAAVQAAYPTFDALLAGP